MSTVAADREQHVDARSRATHGAVPIREQHVDALTGVRALAAGWVVAYHLWLNVGHPALVVPVIHVDLVPLVTMGWLGVDVFFILSGFVLTWQALYERASSIGSRGGGDIPIAPSPHRSGSDVPIAPSFPRKRESSVVRADFWHDAGTFLRRRILRVYPAYLASLTVLLPLAWLGIYRTPPALADIALHLVMFHNLVTRYVDSINGVFWSMPFEWQFYLIFPLLILSVLRGRTRWLVGGAVIVAVAMKLWSALQGPGGEIAQLPWRIDEFVAGMVGAAIAVRGDLATRLHARLTWVAVLSLVAGAWIIGARDPAWWQPGALPFVRAAWIDVTVAALLIGLSGSMSAVARLFASRTMVWLGTISYSIYLWHVPTLELTRGALHRHIPAMPAAMAIAATTAVILAVSALSYYVVERPFHAPSRTIGGAWRDSRVRLATVGAWILAILIAAACAQ